MKKIISLLTILTIANFFAASSASADKPGWVKKYLTTKRPQWQSWHNSLKPKGDGIKITLAENSVPAYVIVIPAKASLRERQAASELQLWLGKITGGKFQIVPDSRAPQARELSVGNTNRVTESARQKAKETGKFGYVIAADKERLLLLGAGNNSPLYAALALLEEDIGVRWYAPNAERISPMKLPWPTKGAHRFPKQTNLTVQVVPREVKPSIPIRRYYTIRYSFIPWNDRNRLNGSAAGGEYNVGVHSFYLLVPPEKYFAKHPEYYALVKGKRRARFVKAKQGEYAQLCLSNPNVAEIMADTILKRLRKARPDRRTVFISPNDSGNYCECEACRKLEKKYGGCGGMVLWFTVKVAEKVRKEFPDAPIGIDIYWGTKQAPPANLFKDIQIPDNVFLRYMLDWGASFSWPYYSMYDPKITPARYRTSSRFVDCTQKENFLRWKKLVPRAAIWMYPAQYRNTAVPMPNIRAMAENIRFFAEQHVEDGYVQRCAASSISPLRNWVLVKLLWNADLDVEELLLDFIFGYYENAAPEVLAYYELLWGNAAHYTNFDKIRDWIYPIHAEEMFRHDFVPKARAILDRALAKAKDADIRRRIEELKLKLLFVNCAQLYMQMRDGRTAPDSARYAAAIAELTQLCGKLEVKNAAFYDGSTTYRSLSDFVDEMNKARDRRFNQKYLPNDKWSDWKFCWDSKDEGVAKQWYSPNFAVDKAWHTVKVPAFLAQTPAGNGFGYGWYRVNFKLTAAQATQPLELSFGAVDEQAWVYVNGKKVGEHSLQSESRPGHEVTPETLWDKPFTIKVKADVLKPGENLLAVRIHNEKQNGGIHKVVRIYVDEGEKKDLCDGRIVNENFKTVKVGEIPAIWDRYVQVANNRVNGIAELKRSGPEACLLLSDRSSNVSVWSKSDTVLPADKNWVVQFDFRLTGKKLYRAHENGALFGLKQGRQSSKKFLPVVQLDNGAKAGKPVRLLAFGQEAAKDLTPDRWYRLAIERHGGTWKVYLDGKLEKTVSGRDSDLRGYAFGSFRNWHNRLEDVELANFKIGGKL
jgi:hypothetical protein